MIVAKQLDLAQSITDYSVTQQGTPRTNLSKQLEKFSNNKISSLSIVGGHANVNVMGANNTVVKTNNTVILSKVIDGDIIKSDTLTTPTFLKPALFTQYTNPPVVKTDISLTSHKTPGFHYDARQSPINLSTKEIQSETLDLSLKKECATSNVVTPISQINPAPLSTDGGMLATTTCQDEPMDFSTSQRCPTPISTIRVANPFEQEPVKMQPTVRLMQGQPETTSEYWHIKKIILMLLRF